MRVLEKHEPAISNHCVVCGTGLDRERQDIVVDTGYDFDSPGHPLDGRKYICQGCVFDLAKVAGLLTATQLHDAKDYLRRYRNDVERIHEAVAQHLDDARQAFTELPMAPNLDHLDSPSHVLVAEENARRVEVENKNWTAVDDDDSPPF